MTETTKTVSLTINGKEVSVENAATVLQACVKAGIKIPTLCAHKGLLPYGACRLCLVEIGKPPNTKIQASCTYPMQQGLIVSTDTPGVIKTRKIVMELLLARCPEVKAIQELAKELGVTGTRFLKKDSDCMLCGMCIRVCREQMGVEVLGFVNRGSKREVKPPFGVLSELCQACGACEFICPTGSMKVLKTGTKTPRPIPFEFNEGLIPRPAVHILYPQAVPNKAAIDSRYCVHMLKDKCGICQEVCEAGAIDYEQKEELRELKAGAVILAPGYDLFDAGLKGELGYGRYPNVISSLEFERILSASGPFLGKVLRPSDRKHPKNILWIQCVGSREVDRNYCSSVCCMYATKEAIIAKEHEPGLDCHIFFIDLRAFGKGFDQYYERAKEIGVKYTRCRPSSIKEVPSTKNLLVRYEAEDGALKTGEFDLVVLSSGLAPSSGVGKLAETFGLELNEHRFCKTEKFTPAETNRPGIYVCGPFTEPKDIPETVVAASAASAKAMALLAEARGTLVVSREYPPETDISGQPPRVGVFVCHCGTNIGGVADVPEVVAYARTLPDVVHAEDNLYTCSVDSQIRIKEKIKEHTLNRVVVASCTPRTHEPLFRNTCREAALNPYLFEMANIRDQNTWVHMQEREQATRKAKDLVRMAVAKSRLLEPLQNRNLEVNNNALVIGAGLSGLTAALELAEQGFEVHLVEKEKEPGGNLRNLHYLLGSPEKPREKLEALIEKVKGHKKIHLHLETAIDEVAGSLGSFKTKLSGLNGAQPLEIGHGTVIVATGAQEYKPKEFLYGQDSRVLTQVELEEKISNNPSAFSLQPSATVVMIQCVGSRTKERPYCSRVCCSHAIKNALKLKELKPETEVYVLYRDVRSYGFREEHYRKAREAGVVFLRYNEDAEPSVSNTCVGAVTKHGVPQTAKENGGLKVTVHDPVLRTTVTINADLLALSTAVIPSPGNEDLAQKLKVPLNQDKFFLEAHIKLRPMDFATDGIFMCGLAHYPKDAEESIAQACAAASRAATILSQKQIELDAVVSHVLDESCDGCAYCIDPCPYKALTLIEYMSNGAIKKTVDRDLAVCKGCGVCQATCPKKGIIVGNFKLEQLAAMVEAALQPAEEAVK